MTAQEHSHLPAHGGKIQDSLALATKMFNFWKKLLTTAAGLAVWQDRGDGAAQRTASVPSVTPSFSVAWSRPGRSSGRVVALRRDW